MAADSNINSTDRLSFTLFLAAALHGLLIFGVSLNSSSSVESAPSVTVTLATHKSAQAPEDADFVAQENQIGSGTLEEEKQITTDKQSPFNNPQIQDTEVLSQTKASPLEDTSTTTVATATASQTTIQQDSESRETQEQRNGQDAEDIERISAEIASLAAKLDKQKQQIMPHYKSSARPRPLYRSPPNYEKKSTRLSLFALGILKLMGSQLPNKCTSTKI